VRSRRKADQSTSCIVDAMDQAATDRRARPTLLSTSGRVSTASGRLARHPSESRRKVEQSTGSRLLVSSIQWTQQQQSVASPPSTFYFWSSLHSVGEAKQQNGEPLPLFFLLLVESRQRLGNLRDIQASSRRKAEQSTGSRLLVSSTQWAQQQQSVASSPLYFRLLV
jgi:hypothetical protein